MYVCNSLCFIYLQKQVIPQTRRPDVSSPVLPSGGSSKFNPAGALGSFYKQTSKCTQGPVAPLPSSSSTLNAVPAKRPAMSLTGKCVAHTEGRFRVEVGYHAELIAVFKSIPSKSYGEHLPAQQCLVVFLTFEAPCPSPPFSGIITYPPPSLPHTHTMLFLSLYD